MVDNSIVRAARAAATPALAGDKTVRLIIDNREVEVPEHTTILDAARAAGISIPTLCYLRELNEVGSCRVCVVEVEGIDQLVARAITTCSTTWSSTPTARRCAAPAA